MYDIILEIEELRLKAGNEAADKQYKSAKITQQFSATLLIAESNS
jgi:hypothetical protein